MGHRPRGRGGQHRGPVRWPRAVHGTAIDEMPGRDDHAVRVWARPSPRTARRAPALRVRLPSPDGDQHAVAGGRGGDGGPPQGAYLIAPHPRHEEQARERRVEPAALHGDPRRTRRRGPRCRGRWAGGEDRGQVRRHERGAPGHRRRRARRSSPLLVELGERRVLENVVSRCGKRGQPVRKTRSTGAESAVNRCGGIIDSPVSSRSYEFCPIFPISPIFPGKGRGKSRWRRAFAADAARRHRTLPPLHTGLSRR